MGELFKTRFYNEEDYENWPENERVELIGGQIYLMAPPSTIHQELVMQLSAKIFNYISSNKGKCKIYPAPFDVRLESSDGSAERVQPDITIICDKSKLTPKGCNGSPDMVIEITSPSNASNDYIKKAYLYEKFNVREYWIVNPIKKVILVYKRNEEKKEMDIEHYTFNDIVKVGIFEGLEIDFSALKEIL